MYNRKHTGSEREVQRREFKNGDRKALSLTLQQDGVGGSALVDLSHVLVAGHRMVAHHEAGDLAGRGHAGDGPGHPHVVGAHPSDPQVLRSGDACERRGGGGLVTAAGQGWDQRGTGRGQPLFS